MVIYIYIYKQYSPLARKYARIFVRGHYLFQEALRPWKTVSSGELIMSKDKYPSLFLTPNGCYCIYYPSNIFRNTHLGNITGF